MPLLIFCKGPKLNYIWAKSLRCNFKPRHHLSIPPRRIIGKLVNLRLHRTTWNQCASLKVREFSKRKDHRVSRPLSTWYQFYATHWNNRRGTTKSANVISTRTRKLSGSITRQIRLKNKITPTGRLIGLGQPISSSRINAATPLTAPSSVGKWRIFNVSSAVMTKRTNQAKHGFDWILPGFLL